MITVKFSFHKGLLPYQQLDHWTETQQNEATIFELLTTTAKSLITRTRQLDQDRKGAVDQVPRLQGWTAQTNVPFYLHLNLFWILSCLSNYISRIVNVLIIWSDKGYCTSRLLLHHWSLTIYSNMTYLSFTLYFALKCGKLWSILWYNKFFGTIRTSIFQQFLGVGKIWSSQAPGCFLYYFLMQHIKNFPTEFPSSRNWKI